MAEQDNMYSPEDEQVYSSNSIPFCLRNKDGKGFCRLHRQGVSLSKTTHFFTLKPSTLVAVKQDTADSPKAKQECVHSPNVQDAHAPKEEQTCTPTHEEKIDSPKHRINLAVPIATLESHCEIVQAELSSCSLRSDSSGSSTCVRPFIEEPFFTRLMRKAWLPVRFMKFYLFNEIYTPFRMKCKFNERSKVEVVTSKKQSKEQDDTPVSFQTPVTHEGDSEDVSPGSSIAPAPNQTSKSALNEMSEDSCESDVITEDEFQTVDSMSSKDTEKVANLEVQQQQWRVNSSSRALRRIKRAVLQPQEEDPTIMESHTFPLVLPEPTAFIIDEPLVCDKAEETASDAQSSTSVTNLDLQCIRIVCMFMRQIVLKKIIFEFYRLNGDIVTALTNMLATKIQSSNITLKTSSSHIRKMVMAVKKDMCKELGSKTIVLMSLMTRDKSAYERLIDTLMRHLEKKNRNCFLQIFLKLRVQH